MILCAGEILADLLGTQNGGSFSYERKAGGAPFNVACAAAKLGAKTAFLGCVGNDLIGDFLIDFANKQGIEKLQIRRAEEANTTLAFVEIDGSGERSFCFYRKNTADYMLPEADKITFAAASTVHIGSLMLSEKRGAEYAEALAQRARKAGKTVSFDVNFRTDIFRDKESAIKAYKKILALADIVKFSEDEVEIFGEKYINEELKEKLVCISLGKRGSEWRYNGRRGAASSIEVKPVDTTGAGDAFYAGVLTRLDGVNKSDWTDGVITSALRFANVCGALNTLSRGAIDGLPDEQAVLTALNA